MILFGFISVINGQNADTSPVAKPVIKWYKFEEALALNNKYPKKKIFIDVYTEWCGWCKKMDAGAFRDSAIAVYMNEHFYPVKFDAERKDTINVNGTKYVNSNPNEKRGVHQIAANLLQGKMSYPSYVFLGEMGNVLTVVNGFKPANEFEPILHYYGDNEYVNLPFGEYKQNFPTRK